MAEAKGALAYWGAWKGVSLRFARKDEKSILEHWRIFGQRRSPITDSPRSAANPANAMLNYLYALLEARDALCLPCLRPRSGAGVFHADQKSRDSLALDLMEAVRPRSTPTCWTCWRRGLSAPGTLPRREKACAACLRPSRTRWRRPRPDGRRLSPRWSRMSLRCLSRAVAVNSACRRHLHRRTAAQDASSVRRNPKRSTPAPAKHRWPTCATCGGPLPNADRQFCDDCLPEERRRLNAKFLAASAAGLAKMHAEERNPMHSEEGRRKLGEANARRGSRSGRMGSDPREARSRGLHPRDTATA